MSVLRLSLAMGDYDRTRPIADGRVKIDGVEPICLLQSPEEMFFNAFRHATCDASELSLSSHAVATARGEAPYVGIPAFLSRAFRHSAIYIRTDRGIDGPEDLAGRRVGIAEWQLTANVWARAILSDYGVTPDRVTWVRGGMDVPGRPEKIALPPPPGVRIEPAPEGATLNAMLAAGEIDAFVGPRSPRCFDEGSPLVDRLFPGPEAASAWRRRTGHFPIMHLLGLRRDLAEAHPWLPSALLKAFAEAKREAEIALADSSAPKATLPFLDETLHRARALGPDLWSYGFPPNRATLDAFLGHHHAQGLSPRRLAPEELFHPSTLESAVL